MEPGYNINTYTKIIAALGYLYSILHWIMCYTNNTPEEIIPKDPAAGTVWIWTLSSNTGGVFVVAIQRQCAIELTGTLNKKK